MTAVIVGLRKTWMVMVLAASGAIASAGGQIRADDSPGVASPHPAGASSSKSQAEAAPVSVDNAAGPSFLEPATRGSRFWGGAEYLLWWMQGDKLPPLVTASPPGTALADAGVLGVPGTRVLFGDSRVNDDLRSGGRFTLGYWLDDNKNWAIGGDFFIVETKADGFAASSDGSAILARPFFNTQLSAQDSEIISFPGLAAGKAGVSTFSGFLGADAFLQKNLCCRCNYWIDFLAGYRFLQLKEGLRFEEQVISASTSPLAPPLGTTLDVLDQFDTENRFHGGELGLQMTWSRGRVSADVLTLLGLGATERTVNINGATSITVPSQGTATVPGGLLALGTNSGRFTDHTFSFVPELRLNISCQLTERLRAFVGYTLLFWTDVARPGKQVDPRINPNFIPPVLGGGEPFPRFRLRDSDLWVQGINLGLSFNY